MARMEIKVRISLVQLTNYSDGADLAKLMARMEIQVRFGSTLRCWFSSTNYSEVLV